MLAKGINPLDAKKAASDTAATRQTFGQCADALIASKRSEWRNAVHAGQWVTTLEDGREPGAVARSPRPDPSQAAKMGHHVAMPYQEVPEFVAAFRKSESVSALALEFLILTAGRSGEVLGARWAEFDLVAKVWSFPASRMKAAREHRVPSLARAIRIVERMAGIRSGIFCFLANGATACLDRLRYGEPVPTPEPFTASDPHSAIGQVKKPHSPARLPDKP